MINIDITKDYKIISDKHNFILQKRKAGTFRGKKSIGTKYKDIGFYPSLDMLADELSTRLVLDMDVVRLKQVVSAIEELKNEIIRLNHFK